MSELNDDYYDLRGAQSLSARLSSAQPEQRAEDSPAVQAKLVRFAGASRQEVSAAFAPWPEVENWQSFAQLSLEQVGASVVFVVDSQGLVIAAEGHEAQQYAESAGARVLVALDRAGEIDDAAGRLVCMALGEGWLTGLKAGQGEGSVTLVLRTQEPMASGLVEACRTALLRVHGLHS